MGLCSLLLNKRLLMGSGGGGEKPLSSVVYLLMDSPDFQGQSHPDVPVKPRGTQTKQKDMNWEDEEERGEVYVGGSR